MSWRGPRRSRSKARMKTFARSAGSCMWRHVLEGSVRKAGNRLRITAQLIKIADGYHLWSERFDRAMDDVFAIQDEISLSIVDKLKVTLLEDEKGALTKRSTENLQAYNLLLQGRYSLNKNTRESLATCHRKIPGSHMPITGLCPGACGDGDRILPPRLDGLSSS